MVTNIIQIKNILLTMISDVDVATEDDVGKISQVSGSNNDKILVKRSSGLFENFDKTKEYELIIKSNTLSHSLQEWTPFWINNIHVAELAPDI